MRLAVAASGSCSPRDRRAERSVRDARPRLDARCHEPSVADCKACLTGVVGGPVSSGATTQITWPVLTGSPGATDSSVTTPARCAVISFSIFIASTMQSDLALAHLVALGHLDGEHRPLHRAHDRVARRRVVRRRRARAPGGGARARRAAAPGRSERRPRSGARRARRRRVLLARRVRPEARRCRAAGCVSSRARCASDSPRRARSRSRPSTKHGCARSARWKPISVVTPSITNSSSARSMRRRARSRSASQTHELGDQRVVERRRPPTPSVDARVDAHARAPPARGSAVIVPGAGRNPLARVLGVDPALDRVAREADVLLARTTAARRRRSSICSRTRSMPVTSSVTVCSTWMRVFISRKK